MLDADVADINRLTDAMSRTARGKGVNRSVLVSATSIARFAFVSVHIARLAIIAAGVAADGRSNGESKTVTLSGDDCYNSADNRSFQQTDGASNGAMPDVAAAAFIARTRAHVKLTADRENVRRRMNVR